MAIWGVVPAILVEYISDNRGLTESRSRVSPVVILSIIGSHCVVRNRKTASRVGMERERVTNAERLSLDAGRRRRTNRSPDVGMRRMS
jgi:hypothetical protein